MKNLIIFAENWLLNLKEKIFLIILMLLVIVKNGIHPIGYDWIDWLYVASQDFPKNQSYLSYSIVPLYEAKILSYPPPIVWWIFNLALTFLVSFYFLFALSKNYRDNFKKVCIIFITLPLFISPYLFVGHYDLITIAAAILAFQSQNKLVIFFASLLAALTNVEQSLVTSLCLLVLCISTKDRIHKIVFVNWSLSSLSAYFLFNLYLSESLISNRAKANFNFIGAVKESLGVTNLILYSLYGVAWFWIVLSIWKLEKFILLVPLVILPYLMCILTVDRTRVGIAVGALPVLLILKYTFDNTNLLMYSERFFYRYFLVYLFIPGIFVDTGEILRLPFKEFFNYLVFSKF